MDLSIIILAAGKGTRMRSSLPKVLHPLGGKSMLSHVVDVAQSLVPKEILIVYGEHKEQMAADIGEHDINWVHQKSQKGTGDAARVALEQIQGQGQVLILSGDVPLIQAETLNRLIAATPNQAVGLLTAQVEDPTGLGRILRNDKLHVVGIREHKDANIEEQQIREVNTGIFLVPLAYLQSWLPKLTNNNAQQEFYLTDVIGLAHAQGVPIHTASPSVVNEVLGVNNRSQLVGAERYFQKRQAQQFLEQGVLICDPNRFDLRGELVAGQDVEIDVNVIFEGKVTLADNVKIGSNCILKNCQIGKGVVIHSHCHIEDAQIEAGSEVGPFARLRPGTALGAQVKVGNFVEIKNSQIASGSKVNHLSYVGDARIGKQVNVGAGTITCNYDGAAKHQTTIEDHVHIGSNCQLVAPVTLGEGATLGAGSTLVKDAPAGKLTLTHKLEQRSLAWSRPSKEQANKTVEEL